MEVRFLQLGLGLLLLLAAKHDPSLAVPSSQCLAQCGGVEIPYPFGIGDNCSLSSGFNLSCQIHDGVYKALLSGMEVLNISLAQGTIRVLNPISTYCYNLSSGQMEDNHWLLETGGSPYRFSDIHNKFTVIGCNTIAYIYDNTGIGYQSGCVSTCKNLSDLVDGSCSGIGCCQTAIPRNMNYYNVYFNYAFNTSKVWRFSRCSYAVLMEAEAFNFSTKYISTTTFNDTRIGQAPVVMDWAIRNGTMTCEVAKHNMTGTYACLSTNSGCVDSANGLGYLCNCSKGYQGNPYLQGGCQDVDECRSSPCPSSGVCHNTEGGYRCSCRAGRKFNGKRTTCDLDTGLIIGLGIGLGVSSGMLLAFGSPFIIRKIKARKVKKMKEKYFSQNHGLLLQQLLTHKADIGERMIITLEELEKATNNFDKAHVIGGGGHGIVFKGILDLHVVAIKKSKIVVQREIDEFINEVAVLSQVNHRNVVKLLGCCLETEVPLLVYEFISNGTLYHHLHVEGPISLPWDDRMRIAMEVARALSYLHSATSMPIFHRDIKSSNILLDESLVAKVSDFGASRYIPFDNTGITTAVQGTIGYLDPEYYYSGRLTDKSDVFSFGVLLVELLTRKKPFGYQTDDGDGLVSHFVSLLKEGKLVGLIDPQIMEDEVAVVYEVAILAAMCTKLRREDRPTMREAEMRLENILVKKKQIPYTTAPREYNEHNTLVHCMSIERVNKEASRQYTMEDEIVLSANYPR
ncbi:hypothetical protein SETIT_6G018100v2 [Setaria italica]|uniref:Protein kinase domain-containing protein n=1 Tax=Setaria italica TaxID=4555 RepID=K3YGF4_SETIT|nr:putative wall-associated receptor kinase-like 16 [Setaria italica]RCV29496.1 hypothetical protein SETIT_6G018100v2 [Setaria italica]